MDRWAKPVEQQLDLVLQLPLGLGFTATNTVSQIVAGSAKADGRIRRGDVITHVDGCVAPSPRHICPGRAGRHLYV